MEPVTEPLYTTPARYRRMENLHIIFWLAKDLAWCAEWKAVGVVMAIPTFVLSVVIAYRTRRVVAEWTHNLAISFWIFANAYWMISEFIGIDEKPIGWGLTARHLALVPFSIGMLILARYYVFIRPKEPAA